MASLAGQEPAASLGVPHDDVRAGRYADRVAAFAASLRGVHTTR